MLPSASVCTITQAFNFAAMTSIRQLQSPAAPMLVGSGHMEQSRPSEKGWWSFFQSFRCKKKNILTTIFQSYMWRRNKHTCISLTSELWITSFCILWLETECFHPRAIKCIENPHEKVKFIFLLKKINKNKTTTTTTKPNNNNSNNNNKTFQKE